MEELLHQPEDIITQRYRIKDLLGQGGSGTTYLAQDLPSGQPAALKALSLRNIRDWKQIELFEREARVLAQLNHPAIPRYLDYFYVDTATDRSFYIAQQLAQGQSLFALVQNGWHTSEEEVRRIATEILEVLVYLHQKKPPVIHRDIKPQNIIRRDDGQVFLVDFGAVADTYHSTFARSSTVIGTFGYMAPEQFIGQAVRATDLYGLGATLLFLLTHRSPADLPTDRLRLDFRSHVQISDEFANWLEKMLEPDVEDRFSSAKEALLVLRGKQMITGKSRKSLRQKNLLKVGIAAVAALAVLNHFKYPVLNFFGITPTGVYKAAYWGDVDAVRNYLEQGVDVKSDKSWESKTLLHLAGSKEVVQLLIAKGASVNAKDKKDHRTPLHDARSPEVAQLLIANGADVNAKDSYGWTPLHLARSAEIAQLLIAKGADVNAKNADANIKDCYGWTPLHVARSAEITQLLIAKGADINARDNQGMTPLHSAIERSPDSYYTPCALRRSSNYYDIVELLLAKGASVNARDHKGRTPLHLATSEYIVELLLAKGASVNARDNQGKTPLQTTNSIEVAKLLIAKGANINTQENKGLTQLTWWQHPKIAQWLITKGTDIDIKARDPEGRNLLYTTSDYGLKDRVKLLIAKGVDVNARDKQGRTPLHYARSKEVAQLLIAKGALVNAKTNNGMTPLHYTRSKEVAQLLIAKGASVNAKDHSGTTPLLQWAQSPELAQLLITKGASVNARDNQGMTPLHQAAKTGRKRNVELLIANGADINARDKEGDTALSMAAASYKKNLVKLLIAKGASVNTRNSFGFTPLHLVAQWCNSKDVVELLIARGANVNAKDLQGATPLHRATAAGNTDVAQLLITKGASVNAKNNEGKTPSDLKLEIEMNQCIEPRS